jgi:DNA-binding protein HU-beta
MLQTTEVVNAIAEITGGTKKDAKAHLDAFKAVVVNSLENGQDIELKGFVNFVSKEVAEGTARNPQTGEEVAVPAHRKASAKLAKSLRKF